MELQKTGTPAISASTEPDLPAHSAGNGVAQPSAALSTLGGTLRERLANERQQSTTTVTEHPRALHTTSLRQVPRKDPKCAATIVPPIFDDPDPSLTTPRLYASQSRIWQALTGHGIDLKKVPSMEFVLLSLIAARGSDGITQPELTASSGQDKRSVPHRTKELARKGYIVKIPVQADGQRTSLCVHIKFVSQSHFLSSSKVEDVYKENTFVLSGFVHLLYSKLKDAGVVPSRDIRKKLVRVQFPCGTICLTTCLGCSHEDME